jgi:hypothetical protein
MAADYNARPLSKMRGFISGSARLLFVPQKLHSALKISPLGF